MTWETKRGRESDEEGRGVLEDKRKRDKQKSVDGRETENRWQETDKW